jgi:ketosteroid isomerase-like protein
MKAIFALGLLCTIFAVSSFTTTPPTNDAAKDKQLIAAMLDSFNLAAGKANYQAYFNFYTSDAIFIGTDATERWDKQQFMVWAKPYFDRGKAWNFKALERHIYLNAKGDMGWFDELLQTQMKICRGSGVVVKQGNTWKVQQYVLSMTIPNSKVDSIVRIKAPIEDSLMLKLAK